MDLEEYISIGKDAQLRRALTQLAAIAQTSDGVMGEPTPSHDKRSEAPDSVAVVDPESRRDDLFIDPDARSLVTRVPEDLDLGDIAQRSDVDIEIVTRVISVLVKP
ncbi:hypothetical protein [Aestuariicoccus sp. MJ-SS9]|uniref:hypothetical protein n=1 Tax=Aestuariicoccus sp. MJ-SS9 TaxID=3079855 RepID=UPI002907E8DC|nr:hypothetical protein [Aestuariicoccus sp. MJ-SS9]MDU8910587.1 hypothetical protein [Aestuariicoccus sp. MJ-SS9]